MVIRCIIAILVVALSGAYATGLRTHQPSGGKTPALERLPRGLSGWEAEDLRLSRETAQVLAADATLSRCYRRGDGTAVWVFVAYFAQQQVNAQIHSPRNCIPGAGWRVESLERRGLQIGGTKQSAARMVVRRNDRRQEVLYWFRTGSGAIAGEYALKWDQVKSALAGRQTNAAFIRYNAEASDSGAVRQLMTLLEPPLDQILGEVGLP